jgi:CxxC motif-containing protein (DUF1111 family)
MANFLFFMERMAPPPPDLSDPISTAIGAIDFGIAGCTDCHASVPFITPLAPFNGIPGNMTFFPFSDFLVHDMGSLGDGIGNTGDTVATRQMRTAPLWGGTLPDLRWGSGAGGRALAVAEVAGYATRPAKIRVSMAQGASGVVQGGMARDRIGVRFAS